MSDVFVSYSRRDQAFVRRLHDALTERGKDVWVDQDDIPAAAKWLDELRGAIESANAFAFVISPDSVASEYRRQEADHALSLGERIVPVLCSEVDPALIPRGHREPELDFASRGRRLRRGRRDARARSGHRPRSLVASQPPDVGDVAFIEQVEYTLPPSHFESVDRLLV